ncbi:hypothetical protein EVG20_g5789 [Dentipellis fragilis]|uniref:PARP catalytic domain-containing protein n=1 Tax=Dentipellis fragilis TaxID=205917 RepID=A0A4Y9YT28_9AGAM|nr:hypothetical protein EVG20_g5789 [Dentipellis fragilis]
MTSNTDSAVVPLDNPGIEELAQGTRDHQSSESAVFTYVQPLFFVNELRKLVVDQFRASWRHPTPCPVIKKIYRIRGKPSAVSAYEAYRANLESVGHFTSQNKNMTEGNEERRWHGSTKAQSEPVYLETLAKQICAQLQPALFVASFVTPSTCPVSAALMEEAGQYLTMGSYLVKVNANFRFGRGIYTSSTSSKSDTPYTKNVGRALSSTYKAMLLTKVAVGRGFKSLVDMRTLTAPPKGYNSVLGEVGVSLNYDELVVYRSNAIIPVYLVIYSP